MPLPPPTPATKSSVTETVPEGCRSAMLCSVGAGLKTEQPAVANKDTARVILIASEARQDAVLVIVASFLTRAPCCLAGMPGVSLPSTKRRAQSTYPLHRIL